MNKKLILLIAVIVLVLTGVVVVSLNLVKTVGTNLPAVELQSGWHSEKYVNPYCKTDACRKRVLRCPLGVVGIKGNDASGVPFTSQRMVKGSCGEYETN